MSPDNYTDDEWIALMEKCNCTRCQRTLKIIEELQKQLDDESNAPDTCELPD